MSTRQTAKADRLPRLLSEQPAVEDRLGVHQRIAEQLRWIIEEITRNGGETKKNVVALFGTWGSGKSTVINLLEKKVRDTHKVIRYDSWSHRDEHLKKAFLLHLLDQLNLNDIPYTRKRKNEITLRDAVAGRVREQTITREPVPISITVYLFGVLFLLGSLSVSLLGILKLLHFNEPLPDWSIITIAFSYLLLSVALFFRKDDIASRILLLKTPLSISEAITSFGEMEIPSIQFQEFFREILKRWKEKENRPLIIVLDNLDRVDDETVSRFFSLIQSALDALGQPESHSSSPNGGLQEQGVFVIPIDKKRVHQVLGKMIHSSGACETYGHRETAPIGEEEQRADKTHGNRVSTSSPNEKESFQEDFLKKLFPYAVEIPELVDYTWRTYFREKLDEAFPMIRDSYGEKDFIVGLFYHGIRQAKRTVTPREIIHFINEMVIRAWAIRELRSFSSAQYQLQPKDVVLAALYTAIIRYDPEWMSALFKTKSPKHDQTPEEHPLRATMLSNVGVMVPKNYKDLLCMLHYNTTNILDMLIVDPILAILTSGGSESARLLESIRSMSSNIQVEDRQRAIVEILSRIFDNYRSLFSGSFIKIGRFTWILKELGEYERFKDQLWIYFKWAVRAPDEGRTFEMVAELGIRYILSDDSFPENERQQIANELGRYFSRVLDEFEREEEAQA